MSKQMLRGATTAMSVMLVTALTALSAAAALTVLTTLAAPVMAAPYQGAYQVASYDEAEESPTFLKFHMESTKFGLLTTGFDGFVKSFRLTADVEGDEARDIRVAFPVRAMDTDVDMRNDKMFDESLAAGQYPEIAVALTAPVRLQGGEQAVPAEITVRGKAHPIAVRVAVEPTDGGFRVTGGTTLSLSALEIPDPSIVIATVDDSIDVRFQVVVRKDPLAVR